MRVATWNINSARLRVTLLTAFLQEVKPDILCLQEIKCLDDAFPAAEVEALGYNVAVHGQKTFNGVAILSRLPLEDVTCGLPGDEADVQARYIEAVVSVTGGAVRVASIYLPNGNPPDSDKYPYKLKWMDRLAERARALLALEEPFVLAGDYNVIPEPQDAARPEQWTNDALFLPLTRAKFRALLNLGLTEALRACDDRPGVYTFWDYQAGAWQKNNGIRIDHLLLSPQAADRLRAAQVHKSLRGLDKPSDHVPVSIDLDFSQ
ncbi:exodeoxyribonuclease III [Pseudochelatococcus sp. B33]